MWEWEFNSNEFYTTCFEADIKPSRAQRDDVLDQRGQSTADPVDVSGGRGATVPTRRPTGVPTVRPTQPPASTKSPGPKVLSTLSEELAHSTVYHRLSSSCIH